ncbi:MAG: hypothetical protein ACOCWA_01660 [Bacteroidota bacterium]
MGETKEDDSYEVVLEDPSGEDKDSWFRVNLFELKGATYPDFEPYVEGNRVGVGDTVLPVDQSYRDDFFRKIKHYFLLNVCIPESEFY